MRFQQMAIAIAALSLAGSLMLPASQDARALLLRPDAPEFSTPAPALSTVRLETSKGVVDIEVTREWAPQGAGLLRRPRAAWLL